MNTMRQYETFEMHFQGPFLTGGYAAADVTAEFEIRGKTTTVRGFYAGDGDYVVRFLPGEAGEYHWRVNGAVTGDGSVLCASADASHHGRVIAQETHFVYEDGTPYIPFGTTVYALASQEDALVDRTIASLEKSPFNKIRMCVFPKDYEYNHNEPPLYPFGRDGAGKWDVSSPDLGFWDRFEKILDRIAALGIEIDLILFHPYDRWGFDALPQTDNLLYLDYLLRRLSARPGIWWSLANEYDLCMGHKSLADWEEIEKYVAASDPYHHLLSVHNCLKPWDYAREAVTHVSIQTKALSAIPWWLEQWKKPVIIDECCYEGDIPQFWGSISAREMTFRFWRAFVSGGYCTHGETYLSDDEILWWSRGGELKGDSPARIGFLRSIAEELPGPLEPLPGWLEGIERKAEGAGDGGLSDIEQLFAESLGRMTPQERVLHLSFEHEWASHCREDAYLWFHDRQCFGKQTLRLPGDRVYRVEMIDVWEMTREILCENASGETTIRLPAREGIAVLAMAENGT